MSESKTSKQRGRAEQGSAVSIDAWITQIYSTTLITDTDLRQYYDDIKYQGFNRDLVLQDFHDKVNDPLDAVKLIILCAIRGPVKAYQVATSQGLNKYGIPLKATKGNTKQVSFNRICATMADVAAFYLKKLNVPKRINTECPAWLQFPSAGSISLPENLREQHRQFSILFSQQLDSTHNEGIYNQMIVNSYYNPALRLF
jgi:hypothetical protein